MLKPSYIWSPSLKNKQKSWAGTMESQWQSPGVWFGAWFVFSWVTAHLVIFPLAHKCSFERLPFLQQLNFSSEPLWGESKWMVGRCSTVFCSEWKGPFPNETNTNNPAFTTEGDYRKTPFLKLQAAKNPSFLTPVHGQELKSSCPL